VCISALSGAAFATAWNRLKQLLASNSASLDAKASARLMRSGTQQLHRQMNAARYIGSPVQDLWEAFILQRVIREARIQ